MSQNTDNLADKLSAKLDEASKRLNALAARAKDASEKAKTEAKAYLDSLEKKIDAQKAKLRESEANAKAWIQGKVNFTSAQIADWKAKREVRMLAVYADGAERYAAATMDLASAAIDEAERATVEAVLARMDADWAAVSQKVKSA